MRPVSKGYLACVGCLGAAALVWSGWSFFVRHSSNLNPETLGTLLLLLFLSWVCCCLPLYIRDDCTVDLSFISILTSTLLLGPEAAVLVSAISFPFVVVSTPDGKGYQHIFNTSPLKTFFNIGDHALSYWVGGLFYYLAGGVPGDISLPGVLLPALLFLLAAMFFNAVVMLLFYMLEYGTPFYPTIFQMFMSLLPSVACASPIGYFLSMLLTMKSGVWLALLFMLPLLLARYSFKLYLSFQRQQHSMVEALTAALEAKDTYTKGHSGRVSAYACRIAREMKLPAKRIELLRTGALFHDLGKIGIPDSILQKPGPLTPEERTVIQTHPLRGVGIVENMDAYKDILIFVRNHHEHYAGGGYPDGTAGEDLPLEVYILGAADSYDAITSARPYCTARTPQDAGRILRAEAGKQFHPAVAEITAALAESGELTRCIPPQEETGGGVC